MIIPAVLAATLFPSVGKAEVNNCHGQVATIVGTPGDDVIYGTNFNDVIAGMGGNDTIYGMKTGQPWDGEMNRHDLICGHGGSDTIIENCGYDCSSTILGGRGADRIESAHTSQAFIDGGPGDDILTGIEFLWGSDYDDTLIGDAEPNQLAGGGGRDLLYGRRGPDYLWESDGGDADELYGNRGNDSLFSYHSHKGGPVDQDLLNGGRHEDDCHYRETFDILVGCESRVRYPLR